MSSLRIEGMILILYNNYIIRVGLEKCLRKIAMHPILMHDEGFLSFLEDVTWNVEVRIVQCK